MNRDRGEGLWVMGRVAQITVYTSNFCSTCQMVKAYLKLHGFSYVERNVSTDLEGRRQLVALGYDSTPVTLIGDRVIHGFDGPAIDAALADLKK
ncbi:MAG: glutaredoxin family protein [Chloroflexi bacterium]|nr:glutaredoxin family protein [Chloroflexota bacterium]